MEKLKNYFFVIRQLQHRNRKRQYSSTFLGILWDVLNPLINMLILISIFGHIIGHTNWQSYPVYILLGTMVFKIFVAGTERSIRVLSGNKALILNTRIPKQLYVLQAVYGALVDFLISIIILVGVMIYTGVGTNYMCLLVIFL